MTRAMRRQGDVRRGRDRDDDEDDYDDDCGDDEEGGEEGEERRRRRRRFRDGDDATGGMAGASSRDDISFRFHLLVFMRSELLLFSLERRVKYSRGSPEGRAPPERAT